ncbi:hypothetical protein DOTSEDRAFT_41164 [Dothistroma septosporum NZE10]|uniref:Uncharacterized protein n=1 Tax=Dothistroma septosporum (strain NZE10 / CBS 128990) TaxID=675120 RepID=N1Q4Y2_DOTSN|nr:hypothetical protein DOTSEDRAFT_41164 [Dothistroma septosporum NZE10]
MRASGQPLLCSSRGSSLCSLTGSIGVLQQFDRNVAKADDLDSDYRIATIVACPRRRKSHPKNHLSRHDPSMAGKLVTVQANSGPCADATAIPEARGS